MRVHITDVFLRDGLQDEHVIVSTEDKLAIATRLEDAGVTRIEVGSFVNPARVPQMADSAALFARRPARRARWAALALNGRGIARAVEAQADLIEVVASASQAHSTANAGRPTADALADLGEHVRSTLAEHPDTQFVAGISTAFTCPFEGAIDPETVLTMVRAFAEMGIRRVGLADTLGNTPPETVLATLDVVRTAEPDLEYSLHLHNAHGRALETVSATVAEGIDQFDSALGGYGGCPFAPGAAGNIDTLALVRHLHREGHETGIDEHRLAELTARAQLTVSESPALAAVG